MPRYKYIGSKERITPCKWGDGVTPGKRCRTPSDTDECPGKIDGKCCFAGGKLHENGYFVGAFTSWNGTEYYIHRKGNRLIPISVLQNRSIRVVMYGQPRTKYVPWAEP